MSTVRQVSDGSRRADHGKAPQSHARRWRFGIRHLFSVTAIAGVVLTLPAILFAIVVMLPLSIVAGWVTSVLDACVECLFASRRASSNNEPKGKTQDR